MDFSYFTSAPQPYQFFGLPQSPPAAQNSQLEGFQTASSTEPYDPAYVAFQQNFQYDPSALLAQTQQAPQNEPGIPYDPMTSTSEMDMNNFKSNDLTLDDTAMGRSSSEEKDTMSTTQQSRRKEQNRAAQRAFRERKERHLKELEARMTSLQHQSAALNGENERLRRELARLAAENEILRATSGAVSNGPKLEEPDELVGPLGFVPTNRNSLKKRSPVGSLHSELESGSSHPHDGGPKNITLDSKTGERLLGAGATWDYIQAHELFRNGLVDVGEVCARLKKMARCDGQGPVFSERDIQKAITESAIAGERDELI